MFPQLLRYLSQDWRQGAELIGCLSLTEEVRVRLARRLIGSRHWMAAAIARYDDPSRQRRALQHLLLDCAEQCLPEQTDLRDDLAALRQLADGLLAEDRLAPLLGRLQKRQRGLHGDALLSVLCLLRAGNPEQLPEAMLALARETRFSPTWALRRLRERLEVPLPSGLTDEMLAHIAALMSHEDENLQQQGAELLLSLGQGDADLMHTLIDEHHWLAATLFSAAGDLALRRARLQDFCRDILSNLLEELAPLPDGPRWMESVDLLFQDPIPQPSLLMNLQILHQICLRPAERRLMGLVGMIRALSRAPRIEQRVQIASEQAAILLSQLSPRGARYGPAREQLRQREALQKILGLTMV